MKNNRFISTVIFVVCFSDRGYFLHINKRDASGTKPPNVTCTFDPCFFPNSCNEREVCYADPNCMPACACAPGFTGSQCESEIQGTSTTDPGTTESSTSVTTTVPSPLTSNSTYDLCLPNYTLRPFAERFCYGLVCMYGKCNQVFTENGVDFNCDCDEGSTGTLCEHKCCKECGENGRCEFNTSEVEYCNCRTSNNIGEYCNITRTNETRITEYLTEDWYLWVVGACAIVLVILLITLIAFPYYLWKKRIPFMMKVVYFFQPFEDDDERKWDAFVSYKSGDVDEKFVIKKLRPMLEDEVGFKLCLHFRDFLPGETIANNILRAVNGSRRTILLLSQRYVESEWTQFEYQIAQELTLQRKHRIIPIVFSDIGPAMPTMDENLKHIIKSITYLEWPGEENEKKEKVFWNKLRLSLPKRRDIVQKDKQLKEIKSNENDITSESELDISQSDRLGIDKKMAPTEFKYLPNIIVPDLVLDMYPDKKQNTSISEVSDELNTDVDFQNDIFSIKL